MIYRSTRTVVDDLLKHDRLLVIDDEVDAELELAEIHRRVYQNAGPALLFNNVKNCSFPVASNLFGTLERAKFIFRKTFDIVQKAVKWKTDPTSAFQSLDAITRGPIVAWHMRPKLVSRAPVMENICQLSHIPHIKCWPDDGGSFVTLPQVTSQMPGASGLSQLNLGMYRVQLNGNEYVEDCEVGLHYQLHRGIGVHHTRATQEGKRFPVTITVGGTPAMSVAAVMPLPEGMSELMFAGALGGHRMPMHLSAGSAPIYADADFCIQGYVEPGAVKPEGPFGDHLGYYAKVHDFPVMRVTRVSHRTGAIWPMTVVGRPPQEDTTFGELIHELTEPVIPSVLPGVKEVNAVDAAGVHPLLLAVGSERYTPYHSTGRPQELLTQASALLGQGQLSLAKYLWIIDGNDPEAPSCKQIEAFFQYVLRRVDWQRDLHFHTRTTIDTLDYSGEGLNQGSKLVVAVGQHVIRKLGTEVDSSHALPAAWSNPKIAMPGILVVEMNRHAGPESTKQLQTACDQHSLSRLGEAFPLIVVVDDADFASRNLNNWLWSTFTRSNPAVDTYGIGASIVEKHFGCLGSFVIDARVKPHHAPPLIEDPEVMKRVDAMAASGKPWSKFL